MKILALQAENIKKLIAVEIRPDGNLVQITGANGQGKTSVLDAIWWALAGASHIQGEPIRRGSDKARIRLDLGEIVVTRNFRKEKDGETTSSITVENADGARFPSPQAMLDQLLGKLSFDPLEFSRMSPRQQFDALRKFVPGVDFNQIDGDNARDYEKRTEINRQVREARSAADRIVVPEGTPSQPIDDAALVDELEKAAKFNADIDIRRGNRANVEATIRTLLAESEVLERQMREKMQKAEDLRKRLDQAEELPQPIDVSALRNRIAEAKQINGRVEQAGIKAFHSRAADEFEAASQRLTTIIETRNLAKERAIAAAKLPVDGLGFGDGQILLNGVPFNQASDAEQLRTSIAIAMALNPKLRVIRVRDGSLLDTNSMKMLAEMADQKDYQVWVERVDGSGKVGFVLENGLVKTPLLSKGAAA